VPDQPSIRTQRLLLRPWRDDDREPFGALNADPEVMEHFPATLTRAESDAFVDRIEAHFARYGYGLWVVEVDGEHAGFVGLQTVTFEASFVPAVEVGWRLARPYWGRGLASEGARAALDYAFDEVRLDEVVSFTAVDNVRSWRVMERVGMSRAGVFDHPRVPEGHRLRPHVLYRIRPADRTW
jgi:ribosomal-protein-alanine N-acetyltransferase